MMLLTPDWYAVHTGKCSVCGDAKSLDSMIADDSKGSSYRCVDCETDRYFGVGAKSVLGGSVVQDEKVSALSVAMRWCFG